MSTRPLQPGGLPAKNVKILKKSRRRAEGAEGNPAAAEWRSAGVARWPERYRGGVPRQIFMLVAGMVLGFLGEACKYEGIGQCL
jgi:hypothetical protein